MKHQQLAGILGAIALITSNAWLSENSAHAITFSPPPGASAPGQSTGGASRGVVFVPLPTQGTPTQTTGGASRGDLFVPAAGSGSPRQGTIGGASRDSIFTPAAGSGGPGQSVGGASRNPVFTPTSSNGSPQQAVSGAARLSTYSLNPATVRVDTPAVMIALLPQSYSGTTVSERPTILVYLPTSTAKEMVFSLKDEAGNLKYQRTLPVSGTAGIIAIALPAEAPALVIGKSYQWLLALKIDGHLSPNTPYVEGWVQRIQPSAELATALQHPDALKRATALGAKGVWYDCVATMALLRATQPNSQALVKDWSDLLVSVGLQDITKAAIGQPATGRSN